MSHNPGPTSRPLLARRLTAGLSLVALPLVAVVGCGSAAESKRASTTSSLQTAEAHLRDSGAASFSLRLDDPKGTLKADAVKGEDALTSGEADLLLGGEVSVTVDPVDGKTLGDIESADPSAPTADRLKLVNVAMSVQADGGALFQLRLVAGDLYVNVDLSKITDVAGKGGSDIDPSTTLDGLAAQAPEQFGPLVADVKAGKWIKLPLADYAAQLDALSKQAAPGASPSVDPQQLMAALRPFVTVTDAAGSGDDRVLDVKVQAKKALQALLTTLKASMPSVPGLSMLDPAQLDRIGDGTANGQLTVSGDHLTKATLDLGSVSALAPVGATPAPDLTGSTVTLDVDDSADEVTVPDDVSSVDIGPLVQQALASLGSLGIPQAS